MALEIERKFLVSGDFTADVTDSVRIVQGYLNSTPERTVRVRIKGDSGVITVKGISSESGMSRFEWEHEIPVEEAEALLAVCEAGVIDKTRHYVPYKGHLFEIDVFHGAHQGLVMAEIELASEDELFEKPQWLGEEVTADVRYYNSMLAKNPKFS